MPDDHPVIEDPFAPTIYFDQLASPQILHGVARFIAYVTKKNPRTGKMERVQVATLIRPADNMAEALCEIASFLRGCAPIH